MEEVIVMVPGELKEASYTLGANRTDTTFGVVVMQALPGLVTAVLLEPVASLPLAVFF